MLVRCAGAARAHYATGPTRVLHCANADGEITHAERDRCIAYCAATGATPETLHELQHYDGAEDIHEVIERGRHLGTAHR